MISETYFPDQRHLLARTVIRRERLLPDAASGEVTVSAGARVSVRDVVARGDSPAPYALIEAARFFNLKDPDKLFDLLEIKIGEEVVVGETLASGPRGKRLICEVSGTVIDVAQGRIVIQEIAPQIELEAGVNGGVVSVRKGRGVVIEAYGAVLQGVWGNNRRTIGTIRHEPPDGIENIFGDMIDQQYRGAVVVTRRPLKAVSMQVIDDQAFSGVIAPSMEPDVVALALNSTAAILITEGFGSQRMSNSVAQFLDAMEGRQATLDAALPSTQETRRPEVIVNVPLEPNARPSAPNLNAPLQVNSDVRLTRGSSSGMAGHVINLPKEPISLENGLRVPCVEVELVTGEKVVVPLANIEVSGS